MVWIRRECRVLITAVSCRCVFCVAGWFELPCQSQGCRVLITALGLSVLPQLFEPLLACVLGGGKEKLFVLPGGSSNTPPAVPLNGSSGSPSLVTSSSSIIMALFVSSLIHTTQAVELAWLIICGDGNLVTPGTSLMFLSSSECIIS